MTERRFTADQYQEALRREIAMRRRVYPGWVASGKMTEGKARYEIEILEELERVIGEQLSPKERLI